MTTTGKNRIMIFGPKTDGTYVVEFRTAEGEALAISNTENRDRGDPALPGAHALWAVCAGRSVRNFSRAREFAEVEPSPPPPHQNERVPETPPIGNLGGVLV
jgi:hypothetical protein